MAKSIEKLEAEIEELKRVAVDYGRRVEKYVTEFDIERAGVALTTQEDALRRIQRKRKQINKLKNEEN